MATFRDVNGGDLGDAARRNDHKLAKWVTQNTVPSAGFRNAVINGGFDVWQRATTATVNNSFGYVSADRWQIYGYGTAASATLARFTHAAGGVEQNGNTRYYANYAWTAGSDTVNSLCLVQNVIEDVRTFSGQNVTLSFWANSSAATNIAVEMEQVFGTGGSPSASVQGLSTRITLPSGSGLKRYVLTFKLPSIVGKTIGTNEDSSLRVNFWTSAGSTYNARTGIGIQASGNFNIWGVQLELGTVASPFERRPVATELSLCQRYYQRFGGLGSGYEPMMWGYCHTAGTGVYFDRPAMVPLRAVPTLSYGGNLRVTNYASAWAVSSLTIQSASTQVLQVGATTAAGPTASNGYALTANGDASAFVAFSAEIPG